MRRVLVALVVAITLSVGVGLYASTGTVQYVKSGCDYFLVDALQGYALLEWYGGTEAAKNDEVAGDFEEYGFHTIYNVTQKRETRVRVEDYWLSKTDALKQLVDACD